ncbi:type IV secretion system effector chaperone VirE1 (plasmid) [Agrobacterium radiobacter]|uniref:Protein virE1 n=2 Tax=Agrobacterium tumefaciens TaxID=358 RepID=VIRE1_AGRTU|nr:MULTISPECIES: type IV secretion system effector chaperone VirE1 [Rhizobium/Agrobacterium group]P07543.1 RecName: Full=Protein virE1 [Agrobacterium tumefaciens]AAA27399.1 virE1 protein [Plasmid pTiA6]AHK05308.1 VirE1 [Agrobacterium tumefaciens LBA4213 (Ach5)]AKC11037.1 type IV secretion system chaperone VirE1 [Agrobacterium tumefaciens]AAF77176.1 virE1 [Agrobacterium tumefaciens]ASK41655.1 protein virE1 [Agrobacterium tumefaciens]
MAIIKPHANKNRTTSPIERPESLIEEMSGSNPPIGFTSLDLAMIELEDFVHRCPLPGDNLAGQKE